MGFEHGNKDGATVNAPIVSVPAGVDPNLCAYRCRLCNYYFRPVENGEKSCKYHPGKYETPAHASLSSLKGNTFSVWTCCNNMNQKDSGCRVGRHEVDGANLTALAAVANWATPPSTGNVSYDEIRERLARRSRVLDDSGVEGKTSVPPPSVTHVVTRDETLAGIAIRYGVTPQAIKVANRMPSENVYMYRQLVIPSPGRMPTADELNRRAGGEQEQLLSKLIDQTRTPRSEAVFYLTEAKNDVEMAARLIEADRKWEREHPMDPSAFKYHEANKN